MIDSRFIYERFTINGKRVSFVWLRLALFAMVCSIVGIVAGVVLGN